MHSRTGKEPECPVCHQSDEVIPIVYGLPGYELAQKSEQGRIRLGGCMVTPDDPHWYCKRDDFEWS
jgi:hypothetical protein